MKKIFIITLLCVLSVLATSCNKEEQDTPTMKGEFYAGMKVSTDVIELFPGGSQSFDIRAYAYHNAVCDVMVNFTFKTDPSYVDAYNAQKGTNYEPCPGSAFEFTKGEVMMPRYGQSSTTGKVKVVASGLENGKVYMLPIVLEAAKEGQLFDVADTLGAYIIFKQLDLDPSKGLGTADYPFLVYNVDDLKDIDSKLQETSTVYFKLVNDIDMAGVTDWVSLNANQCKFDFDGAGFSISNFTSGTPLFDTVAGKIHDLYITNANITMSVNAPAGIVASRLGASGNNPGVAEHVSVGGKLSSTQANGAGGLFGVITDATINACSAAIELTCNKYDVGGIFGYDASKSTVTNCWTSGKIVGNNRFTGGIVGQIVSMETSVCNCYSTASVDGHFYFGGISGAANLGAKADNSTNTPGNHIEKCIAWNEYVKTDIADSDVSEHYSAGAIIGYTALKNYQADCYRRSDMVFKDCPGNSGNILVDQANSSPENPLSLGGLSGTYVFPYHGKAAGAGETASDVAKRLGWDETVWDLSGPLPFFKGASGPIEDPDVPSGGQLPDFDENEFYN